MSEEKEEAYSSYQRRLTSICEQFRKDVTAKVPGAYQTLVETLKALAVSMHAAIENAIVRQVMDAIRDSTCGGWVDTNVEPIVTEIVGREPRPVKPDPDEPPLTRAQVQIIDNVLECAMEAYTYIEQMTVALRSAATKLPPSTFLRLVESAPLPRVQVTHNPPAVQVVPKTSEEVNLEQHLPRPTALQHSSEETNLLAAFTYSVVRTIFCPLNKLSQENTAKKFAVHLATYKRISTGRRQLGGTAVAKRRRSADESEEAPPKKKSGGRAGKAKSSTSK